MRLLFIPPAVTVIREFNYYTTYENHQISAVHMHHEDLDGTVPVRYPVLQGRKNLSAELKLQSFFVCARISRMIL